MAINVQEILASASYLSLIGKKIRNKGIERTFGQLGTEAATLLAEKYGITITPEEFHDSMQADLRLLVAAGFKA